MSFRVEQRHTLTVAAALFSVLFSLYLLSYSGTFTADDEQHLAAGAQTFALSGQLAALPLYGNPRLHGNFYDVDPALPVLGALVYRLVAGTPLGAVQALYLINPFVTALTGVLVFLIGREWGYEAPLAAGAALLYGAGSMAWPYAGTFFRDPLAALFVAGAWLCYERALSRRTVRAQLGYWAGVVVLVAAGVLAKNIVIPLIPVLALAAGLRQWRSRAGWGLAAGFAGICLVLLLRPETPFLFRSSGAYFAWLGTWLGAIPHTGFWGAFWGALVSPGKGLLVYASFAALAALGWLAAGRDARPRLLAPALWVLTAAAAQAFVYDYRWTNPQWGARFLLPALPALAASTLPALDWLWARSHRLAGAAWGTALGAGLLTQLPGVLIAPPAYSAVVLRLDPSAYYDLAIWNPYYSAIAGHWRLQLSGAAWSPAWARILPAAPAGALLVFVASAAGLAAASALLWRACLRDLDFGLPGRTMGRAIGLALLLALAAPPALLAAYRADPAYSGDRPETMQAVRFLNDNVRADTLVAVRGYLDPFWYCYFNFGRPRQPWAGLPLADGPANDAPPGDPFYLPGMDAGAADVALFEDARDRYAAIWFVADPATPAGSEGMDVEAWLKMRYPSYREQEYGPEGPVRIVVFYLHVSIN